MCWNFKDRHFFKGYPYISSKHHFRNAEKEGGVICKGWLSVGNSSDGKAKGILLPRNYLKFPLVKVTVSKIAYKSL